ncbi:c-type cytochrome [Trinickia terrae]|uniref:Methylamine utilization protein MauG n=2 Tax=Trinickia terrae TaxID=2571161 RepID=A0A4U1I1G2_9BURK|nr:c-type cytochrome [Trinickia terrae]
MFPRAAPFRACVLFVAAVLVQSAAPCRAQDADPALKASFARPASIPFPADNPYTPAKATLGKMLFFDPRLSRDRNISCASCHNPSFGWEVPFAQAIGAGGKPLPRHAPTVLNQAWSHEFFLDGRAPSLEEQAKGPIQSAAEMDLPLDTAVSRLNEVAGYRRAFETAFPKDGLNATTIVKAIATYERTVVSAQTPFDRWISGDSHALSESEQRGFHLFTGKAHCIACHGGWNFTDNKFHDIGLVTDDKGRSGVTKNPADDYAFKTPGLREVAARAPYMHKGQYATLEAVVAHYETAGVQRPTRDPLIQPFTLSGAELTDLVAFLKSLSSPQATLSMPNLPAN